MNIYKHGTLTAISFDVPKEELAAFKCGLERLYAILITLEEDSYEELPLLIKTVKLALNELEEKFCSSLNKDLLFR